MTQPKDQAAETGESGTLVVNSLYWIVQFKHFFHFQVNLTLCHAEASGLQ